MATLNKIADEIGDALNRPFDWMFKARIKEIFRHEAALSIRQAINKNGIQDQFKTRFSTDVISVDGSHLSSGTAYNYGTKDIQIRSTNKLATPIRYNTDDPFTYVGDTTMKRPYIYSKPEEIQYGNLAEVYSNNPIRYTYLNEYVYIHNRFNTTGTISAVQVETGYTIIASTTHGLTYGYSVTIFAKDPRLEGSAGTQYYKVGTYELSNQSTYTITTSAFAIDTELDDYELMTYYWELALEPGIEYISVEGVFNIGDVFDSTIENRLSNKFFDDDTTIPLPEDLIQGIKLKLLSGELRILDDKDKAPDSHLDN